MLICFKKYTTKYKINKSTCILSAACSKKFVILHAATFFRKFYFRTLLLYLNILYANYDSTVNYNFFYIYSFPMLYYSKQHPSFYYRTIVNK